MTSIDDLFRKPSSIPTPSSKRKLEDPTSSFSRSANKSAKHANGTSARSSSLKHPPPPPSFRSATVVDEEPTSEPQDEDLKDIEAGPSLPPEDGPEEVGDDEEGRFFGSGITSNEKSALNLLDQGEDGPEAEEKIDLPWLKRTAINFERKINKNAELRAKYEDEPIKFVSSEADLDAEIKGLSILPEHGELYKDFVRSGCVSSLVSLLAHENTDIAIAVCEVIAELTDEDTSVEDEDWKVLVDALINADIVDLLISNLGRLNETANDNDRDGVYHVLSVIENLLSEPSNLEVVDSNSRLLSWLVSRIKTPDTTSRGKVGQNRQYAAELLAILLQGSRRNRSRLAKETEGVDTILQILAAYRKHDPEKDSDEEELVENLFDCVTCLVEDDSPATQFLDSEGVELCLIMLREGKLSKSRALKVLNHGMSGAAAVAVCDKVIEAAGLKTLFGLLMKSKKEMQMQRESMEHMIGILASLLRYTPAESPARIRTLAKFVEKDYEKISRLVELRAEYMSRLDNTNAQILVERQQVAEVDAELEDEWLSRRLDAGLFSLQTLDVILSWLVAEDDGARMKIKDALDNGGGLDVLEKSLQEQLDGIEDESGKGKEGREMLEALLRCLK